MKDGIVLQSHAHPAQLFLLFHGVGATAASMTTVGNAFAKAFPQAQVVLVQAPEACEHSIGAQWFSIKNIDEQNRPTRVAQAMPAFVEQVLAWQNSLGVSPEATALIGFSQGAIMALESSKLAYLAGRIIAFAGRFASLPLVEGEISPLTTLHLIHGKTDAVIPYGFAVQGAEHLISLKVDVTCDVLPHTGHEIKQEMLDLSLEKLSGYVPKRIWDEAMQVASKA